MKKNLFFLLIFFNNFNINAVWGSWFGSSQSSGQEAQSLGGQQSSSELLSKVNLPPGLPDLKSVNISGLNSQETLMLQLLSQNQKLLEILLNLVSNSNQKFTDLLNVLVAKNSNVIVSLNAEQVHSNSNSNSNKSESTNSNKIQMNSVQQMQNNIKIIFKDTRDFLSRYKIQIILATIITTFVGLAFKLRNLKNTLNSNASISNCWHQNKTLEEIMEIPTEKLTEDLLQVICDKYAGIDSIANSSIPMAKFLNAIEIEKNMLLTYVKIAKILTTLKLARIFFLDTKILEGHKERLAKLSYMQKLFEEFMSKSYKSKLSSASFA